MTKAEDRELLRRLAGERRADEDGEPRAAAARDRLAALWAELEAPPAEPAPPGFAGRVMARVREAGVSDAGARDTPPRRDTLTRRFGAVPARLAAASALAAGLVSGAWLGALIAAPGGEVAQLPAAVDGTEHGARGDAAAAGGQGSAEPGESPAAAGALDEETLIAAAVAAATGEGAGGGEELAGGGGPGAPFVAEPDLADGYLAALAALEEAS